VIGPSRPAVVEGADRLDTQAGIPAEGKEHLLRARYQWNNVLQLEARRMLVMEVADLKRIYPAADLCKAVNARKVSRWPL